MSKLEIVLCMLLVLATGMVVAGVFEMRNWQVGKTQVLECRLELGPRTFVAWHSTKDGTCDVNDIVTKRVINDPITKRVEVP